MQIQVQLVIEDDMGTPPIVKEVAQLTRDALSPENLGLSLAEAKTLLHRLQLHLVEQQVSAYQQQQRLCPDCQRPRRVKDRRKLVCRSLFGV